MASKDVDSLITAVDKSFAPTTKDATLKEVRQNNCKQSVSLKKVTPKATKAQGKTFGSKLKESVIPFKKTELHTTQPSKFGLGSLANRLEISIPSLSSVNTAAKARMRTPSTLGSKEEVVTVRSPPSIARDTFEELTIPTDSPQNVSSTAISAVTKPMATIGFKRKFATKFNNTASIKKPLKDESVHSSTAAVTAKVDKRSTDLAALAPVPKSKQKVPFYQSYFMVNAPFRQT